MTRQLHTASIWLATAAVGVAVGCATTEMPRDEAGISEGRPATTSVEVAEIEISGSGEDRFVSCPPPGELGQAWIPAIPAWMPPSDASEHPRAAATQSGTPEEVAAASRAATQNAITETFPDFRTCHYKGLRVDPTQDGHVAIIARIGPDGHVAKVEEYGACNISSDVIECMRGSASKLRFDPPPGGSMTVTIPAYFASPDAYKHERAPSRNDTYTASAFITVEQARPQLHTCEAAARKAGKGIEASATMLLTLDGHGRVTAMHLDPWSGNQELLMCAAQTFQSLTFAPPPAGRGNVTTRVVFNPRAGSR
jgi:hypothetical protein